jgi:transcriptional regulator
MAQETKKTRRQKEMIGLRRKGLRNDQIAAELGTTERAVATVFCRAKKEGLDVPLSPYWARRASARSS